MSNEEGGMSFKELTESCMTQSLMLFILANLQNLSSTGRVRTKYEYLCIDSDRVPRGCAADFACFADHDFKSDGITAAHMIAVFLLEIACEAEDLKKQSDDLRCTIFFDLEENRHSFELTRNNVHAATGMHALLDIFKNLIAADMSVDVRKVGKEQYSLHPPRKEANSSGFSSASYFSSEVVDDEEEGLFNGFFRRTHPVLQRRMARRNKRLLEIAHLQDTMFNNATSADTDTQYTKQEWKDLLEQAIEQRDYEGLGFLKEFFKEGSFSRMLVESKIQMVWINSWFPNECTYGISVDYEKKQVFCIFRGCFTKSDWQHAFDFSFTSTSNPIAEDYPRRTKNVKIHGGYHKYLFRVRRDTGTTKYDEISSKVAHYCNLVGEGVTLTVTGHSLGAALATLFSFYASTDDRFTRNGAIEMVGFGGPTVGGYKFADAVRHQEAVGKLRMARFHVGNDGVAHLPPALFSLSKRGATYFNNGVDVRLPLRRLGIFKIFPQPQPRVTYINEQTFLMSWLRQIKDFYFFNLPVRLWLGSKMHSMDEHKKRLELVNQLDDPQTSLLVRYSLAELYEIRDTLK